MQKEIWKSVPNYEDYYQVSDHGSVRSIDRVASDGRLIKGRVLKVGISSNGYKNVGLCINGKKKTFNIHQLVAMVFLGHKSCGYKVCVDHRNNIKTDNRLENLQLISIRENTSKDKKGCSSKYTGVCWDKQSNKWKSSIRINGKSKHLGLFDAEEAAAAAYQKELIKLNNVKWK